jgi:4-amino-4-deoxy-L-arabinose transferase-like glycosyltransferase
MILTSQSIYCDTQLTALSVWALERMLAWRQAGGRGRLIAATLLTGLAAGAKYPGGFLVLRWRGW